VFDDPSLYWPSYGFLNFRRLAEHAQKHGYCAAIATIPIDCWKIHKSVAETFRKFNSQLSLLVHGNNHTSRELLFRRDPGSDFEECAQALRRMERLERKCGVAITRVMEPPHGAIAYEAFGYLLALGYDAALCATEHLVGYNRHISWLKSVGLGRSEMLGGGLPVVPRIIMSSRWRNDVLLAGFLRQPIVVAGHHQNAAEGLGFLEEISRTVNSLGHYAWCDVGKMLRANYLQRVEGEVVTVRMYSRRIQLTVPNSVRRIRVVREWLGPTGSEPLTLRAAERQTASRNAGQVTVLEIDDSTAVEIVSEVPNLRPLSTVRRPRRSFWSMPRKLMMEVRDRLSPMFRSAFRTRHSPP
jgi:hypothetical protein